MAKPFSELLRDLSPSDIQAIDEEARALHVEYELLRDLRVAHTVTQQQLADLMEVRQASISKFERQDDILVSTLRRYVEALGGQLEVRVRFQDHAVVLSRYGSERAVDPEEGDTVPA
jgi:transcriptional regulator with XRE-family HTH domain